MTDIQRSDTTIPIRLVPEVRSRLTAIAKSLDTSINGVLARAAHDLVGEVDHVHRRGARAKPDDVEHVTTLTLRIGAPAYAKLEALSVQRGESMSTMIREHALTY